MGTKGFFLPGLTRTKPECTDEKLPYRYSFQGGHGNTISSPTPHTNRTRRVSPTVRKKEGAGTILMIAQTAQTSRIGLTKKSWKTADTVFD